MVASADGDALILDNQKVEEPLRVYNFSVENTPSYFAGAGKLWVHNSACDPLSGSSSKLRTNLNANKYPKGWAAHHLITTKQAGQSKAIQAAALQGVYNQNSKDNGLMLPTKTGVSKPEGVDLPDSLPIHKSAHNGNGTAIIGVRVK